MKETAKRDVIDKYLKHLRVLLVEDSLPVQRMIRGLLKDIGVGDVLTVGDGEKALALVDDEDTRVGLIIFDCHMPKLNGLNLLRALRDRGQNIPFLMISSDVSKETVSAAVAAGVSAYVRKPFSQKEITDRIVHITTAHG